MKNYKQLNIFLAFLLISLLSGCRDDDMPYQGYGEGEAPISVEVKFRPLSVDLNTRTPGNAIKDINSLSVIVYNADNKLVKVFNKTDLIEYDYSVIGNSDMPTTGNDKHPVGDQAEVKTARATFKLPAMPYGNYRFYAVANMGDITKEQASDLEALKKTNLKWNTENISANNQMFGYFTRSDDQNGGADGFDAPLITINKENTGIHAWIKRAASKVTVAFDPSGLNQSVWIYVHDVSIRDIPAYCKLGENNTPLNPDSLLNPYNATLKSLPASSKIIYGKNGELSAEAAASDLYQDFKNDVPESVYSNWLELSKGSGIKGSDHSETANALFFYENMQGDYEKDKKYDKTIVPDDITGDCVTDPSQKGFKNGVRYGTYIEVTAFYVSQNPQNTTKGKIKYRFMLGKNTTYNFNAQRNHHYKLTLGFNGWANQPKWNIEYYEEEPGIYVPDDFYVSYLYNQKHMMPIKIVGNCTNLRMEIVENNWAPYDPDQPDEVPPAVVPSKSGDDFYSFKWNRAAWNGPLGYRQKIIAENTPENQLNNRTWFGFLALAVPVNTGMPPKNIIDKQFSDHSAQTDLKNYYETNNGVSDWNTGSQGERDFDENQLKTKEDGGAGSYYPGHNGWQVTRIDNQSKMLMVPLFTRNKSMIVGSGFSGDNPYDSYQRKAVVRITATFTVQGGGRKTIVKQVPVYQVRRVVNPKGIWRRYNDNAPFDVTLLRITDVTDINSPNYFTPFVSDGPWKAYVEVNPGNGFLTLGTKGQSYKKPGINDTIYGDTGTPIEMMLNFSGVADNDSRCAVVRVDYHGDNCVHKIMVRQGYMAPMQVKGNAKWSSFSLYSCGRNSALNGSPNNIESEMTVSPLALGTFFKRHNTQEGIRIINNNTLGPLIAPNGASMTLTTGGTKAWNDISAQIPTVNNYGHSCSDYTSTWGTFTSTVNGLHKTYRLPTYEDFQALDDAEYGFGVLYADGTSAVQTSYEMAYGYQAPNNLENGPDTGKGARGVIVYNRDNGNQIFFPVGKNGMGRRTQFNIQNNTYSGVLRYSDVYNPLEGGGVNQDNAYRPVPYNLPTVPGAIYWINTVKQNGNDNQWPCAGWDMNYFSFDFNSYPDNNTARFNDARPIKLIVTN